MIVSKTEQTGQPSAFAAKADQAVTPKADKSAFTGEAKQLSKIQSSILYTVRTLGLLPTSPTLELPHFRTLELPQNTRFSTI